MQNCFNKKRMAILNGGACAVKFTVEGSHNNIHNGMVGKHPWRERII